VYTGDACTMEVADGVLKLTASGKSGAFQKHDYNLVFDKTDVVVNDPTKPFAISMKFRASNTNGPSNFIQFHSDFDTPAGSNSDGIGQLNAGLISVAKAAGGTSINKPGGNTGHTPASDAAVAAGLTNLHDGQWHVVDYVFTPNAAGKLDFVGLIDGVIVCDSKTTTDTQITGALDAWTVQNSISTFRLDLYLHNATGAGAYTFEMDYFRAGNLKVATDDNTGDDNTGDDSNTGDINGDTSDMLVSVAAAAVALVATTAVVLSKKRH